MVPAADIGKRHLHAEIRFDQLRELAQAVAEASLGIVGAGRGLVLRRVRGLQHLDRVKRFFAGAVQHGIERVVVHGLESIGDRRGFRIASADGKIVDVVDGDGRLDAAQDARNRRAHGDGLEGRFLRWLRQLAHERD